MDICALISVGWLNGWGAWCRKKEHLRFDWKPEKVKTQGGDMCKCQIRLKEQLKRDFSKYFINAFGHGHGKFAVS